MRLRLAAVGTIAAAEGPASGRTPPVAQDHDGGVRVGGGGGCLGHGGCLVTRHGVTTIDLVNHVRAERICEPVEDGLAPLGRPVLERVVNSAKEHAPIVRLRAHKREAGGGGEVGLGEREGAVFVLEENHALARRLACQLELLLRLTLEIRVEFGVVHGVDLGRRVEHAEAKADAHEAGEGVGDGLLSNVANREGLGHGVDDGVGTEATLLVHARVQAHRRGLAVGVNVVVGRDKVDPCVIVRHHKPIKAPRVAEDAVE
mmetsp:Transcript_46451/g.129415  ORF Transcript_46451/g.129415 Transcript_46451/m.129415 type:complete len:259 (+) Transcript_46451:987-1763(+)